jgi:hypothetical protein
MGIESALATLSKQTINITFGDTADKSYDKLQRWRNTTSYSMMEELHRCPRKFQLIKARAASGHSGANNVDFAFGHAVGSGIQSWLASGKDMDAAIFNALMAWRIPYGAEIDKKNKSIWRAVSAVQKYALFYEETMSDWHVWVLPNGKPAIELSVSIDFENGYKHYCHIDVILEHNYNGKLAIQENKTTGFKIVEEAIYANSSQALGYSILIDQLSEHTSYEVFYNVFSAPACEWQLLPFTKHTSLKAEWILDTKIDHQTLDTYHQVNFYPKRGESCFAFQRRCEFFGMCNMTANLKVPADLPLDQEAERVDYAFKISDIVARQHHRNQTVPEQAQQPEGVCFENLDDI